MLERRHVCERTVEEIASKSFVADIADVIVPQKDSTPEVIDPVNGSDTQTLDTSQ